jgi:hypothetical protein
MPPEDRDKLFERALARHLPGASPGAACPDGEILAAYHERSLSLDETAHWKLHIAACSRCQETLALLEQTDSVVVNEWEKKEVATAQQSSAALHLHEEVFDEISVPSESASASPIPLSHALSKAKVSAQRRAPWRLFVPVGALAAGLLVWVALHEKAKAPENKAGSVQIADNRSPSPSNPVEQNSRTGSRRDELPASKMPEPSSNEKPAVALSSPGLREQGRSAGRSGAPPPSKTQKEEGDKVRELDAANSVPVSGGASVGGVVSPKVEGAPVPAPPRAIPRSAGGPSVVNQTMNQAANQTANQAMNQAATDATKDSQQELKRQKMPAQYAAEVASQDMATSSFDKIALQAPRTIVAPGSKHIWRVGAAGEIERSTDGGKSWSAQNSGVTAPLTSGSAPSNQVCWIVGKTGTLLLTTDGGKHWKQLTSPIAGDLGGVHAVDAQHASIWDEPNRKGYETTDGGVTWKQTANE